MYKANISHIKTLISLLLIAIGLQQSYAQSTVSQNQDGFHGATMDGFLTTETGKDSTVVERRVSKEYSQWIINTNNGLLIDTPLDTIQHYFENQHLTEGENGEYSYLGNMGTPRLSRLYFDREESSDFIFEQPYDYFLKDASKFRFTDTKTPHLNLSYFKGGNRNNGEERIKGYFAANFNKKLGIGIDMDYLLGRGRYDSQSTSMFDARLYSYWRSDRYSIYATMNSDKLKIAENGGIADHRYITNPEAMADGRKQYAAEDIPFRLLYHWNNINRKQAMISQSLKLNKTYHIPDSIVTPDTIIYYSHSNTKTISTVSHILQVGNYSRNYIYHTHPANFYQHTFLKNDSLDNTGEFYITNTLAISLNEGFNKWAIADVSAYLRHEMRRYTLPDTLPGRDQELTKRHTDNNIIIGAEINRSERNNFSFSAGVESVVIGADMGDISLDADIKLRFPLFKESATIAAVATMSHTTPSYYYESFHSRYCWWDNSLSKEFTTRLTGLLNIERTNTEIMAGVENRTNYTYLANVAPSTNIGGNYLPIYNIKAFQYNKAIQILSATIKQGMSVGPLHWDNNVTWQVSSNSTILPLPMLNIFSDLYFKFLYSKRLEIEAGANVTIFSEYGAPTYSPAVGSFHLQSADNIVKVGGYPLVNAYVNCRIEGVRFYVMYYHANNGLLKNRNAFFVPNYPINPSMFKFGLSWTFFD